MNQFSTILKYELKSYLQKKIFIGVTVFLVLLIAILMFLPQIAGLFGGDDDGSVNETQSGKPVLLVVSDTSENVDIIEQSFAKAFTNYDVIVSKEKLDEVKNQITSQKAECAFVLNGLTSYEYYVNNLSMYDENTSIADTVLQDIYRISEMTQNGISLDDAKQIITTQIEHTTTTLGKVQAQNFFYTYIMIFALYIVILLYGQMVATNVATEKSSRAMELLITSAKPVSMMFGKVIASCLAGLIQLVAVFGSAYLFYNINKSYWESNTVVKSIFDMPLELLMYMLIFFVLGFFLYAFMYGAIGSTASKLEDINTSVMPLTILFVVAFMVVITSMMQGTYDNMLMIICSYVPFTSPIAMFTRIAMSTVPVYEIIISIAILIVSVFVIGVIAAKIYRVGVLLYGTKPKLSSIIKAVKEA